MKVQHLPLRDTGFVSGLICDYLEGAQGLKGFHNGPPSFENLNRQAVQKKAAYPSDIRSSLCTVLAEQYHGVETSPKVVEYIKLLQNKTTLTVTTGHQLCLMTGPLYFIYKIISTIKLSQQLKKKFSDFDFVPVYWMASEDHDFKEISSFIFKGKKFQWNTNAGGVVGKIQTESLTSLLDLFKKELGDGIDAIELRKLIERSYESGNNLSDATRVFVNQLFGHYGLLILDADHRELKKYFTTIIKEDLLNHMCNQQVLNQIELIKQNYSKAFKPQVNPREVNLFFIEEGQRSRIVKTDNGYHLEGSDKIFSVKEMIEKVDETPEKFSPNVLLRPLYQEVILPNIAYFGGGGELAYWLELKSFFDSQKLLFPILCLRNMAMIIPKKSAKKIRNLKLDISDLFLKRNALINKKVRQISNIDLDLSPLKNELEIQFDQLEALINETDASFEGAVKAQKSKQFKGIDHLEKRLLKAQKKKLEDQVERLVLLHEHLFPGGNLQERVENFSTFQIEKGNDFNSILMEVFDPLSKEFTFIEI